VPTISQIKATSYNRIYRHYEWEYKLKWTWDLTLPVDDYLAYTLVPLQDRLVGGVTSYGKLVTTDDQYIRSLANALTEAANGQGYDYYEKVDYVLAFVQGHYLFDNYTSNYDEYPKFPIETLVEGGGDCEDSSILFATIMKIMGYDVILINPPGHMAAAVLGAKGISGWWYVQYNNNEYYICETTGTGWTMGDCPPSYQHQTLTIVPITGDQFQPQPYDYSALKGQYDSLSNNYNSLNSEYNQLNINYDNLTNEYSSLRGQYNNLQVNYNSLETHYNSLNLNYTSLQNEYNSLSDQFQSLQQQLSSSSALNGILGVVAAIAIVLAIYGRSRKSKVRALNPPPPPPPPNP
jgi:hypothetical protein